MITLLLSPNEIHILNEKRLRPSSDAILHMSRIEWKWKKKLCSPSLSFISIRFGSCVVRRLNRASLNNRIIIAKVEPRLLHHYNTTTTDTYMYLCFMYCTKQNNIFNKPFFLSCPTDCLSFQGSAPGISSF